MSNQALSKPQDTVTNSIIAIVVFTITALSSTLILVLGIKRWRVAAAFIFIYAISMMFIVVVLLRDKEVTTKAALSETSTVPTLQSMTNGLYSLLGGYRGPDGNHLAILHRARIISMDSERRLFTSQATEPRPVLVVVDHPMTDPGDTNAIFTGYVEILDENGKKVVRDYLPFRYLK